MRANAARHEARTGPIWVVFVQRPRALRVVWMPLQLPLHGRRGLMGLPWIRLDTSMPDNPKILGLETVKDGHRAGFMWLKCM